MRARHLAGSLLGAAMLVSACSGGGITPLPEDEPLPMDALLANTGVSATTRQQLFDQTQLQIKECMAGYGFEYFPASIALDVEIETLPTAELRAYAADHGYGLTELLLPAATALDAIHTGVLPQHVEFDLSAFGLPDSGPAGEMDPNDLYVLTLSSDELDAYATALDGPQFIDEQLEGEPTDLGCRGEGYDGAEQQYAAPEWLDEASFLIDERLHSARGEFDQTERLWAECMSEQGFDQFGARLDAPESIRAGILDQVFLVTGPEDQLDPAALRHLHEREMALAAADAKCYSAVYRPAVRGIEHRIQTEVLTELGVIEG